MNQAFARHPIAWGLLLLFVSLFAIGAIAAKVTGNSRAVSGNSGQDAAQRWCRSQVHIGDSAPKLFISGVPSSFGLGPNAAYMTNGYWIPTGYGPDAGDGVAIHFRAARVDWFKCG